MKKTLVSFFIFLSLSSFAQNILNNKDIISLVESKIGANLISAKISSAESSFDLSTEGIINLKENKVSDRIINQMIEKTSFDSPITNEDIIEMTKNKIPYSIIKTKMASSPRNFDVSTDGLIALKNEKVSSFIVKEMILNPSSNEPKETETTESQKKEIEPKVIKNSPNILIVRDIEEVKGLQRLDEVSASAKKLYGSQDKLREDAMLKIKQQAQKMGATHVYIQKDEFQATPVNNVYIIGVAYKR